MSNVAGGARTPLLVAAVTLAIGVSACSGGSPEPKQVDSSPATSAETTPSSTPSPSASPSPTSPPSAIPTGDLETQLKSATVDFYAAIDEAYKTLNTEPIKKLTTSGSVAADGYVKFLDETKKKGHRFAGLKPYKIDDFQVMHSGSKNPSTVMVRFVISASEASEVDSSGKRVGALSGGSSPADITFVKVEGKWVVSVQNIKNPF